ncbi:dienelactone hydrolase family protein [Rosenbergiella epipactidis]|uniref:dienelactone hydrolase family protein n=1 Tax=Rosenbergiella epipactidis TaxID=1544694 RepID=UPI001BD9E45B|nr:dienelactone hydrolase family protein [Rosenbergiella epipactidis]MBT0718519.1 dienelactone hydrolase family protein [Rosenbergiella epipactidis]
MSQITTQTVRYQAGETALAGTLVFPSETTHPLPGLVMAPNWFGVTDNAAKLAKKVAEQGYVVLLADLYGESSRPTNADEAGAAMMAVKNTPEEVGRMNAAIDALKRQTAVSVDAQKISAFGFCFGGHCALELARSGADIRAAISFHGGLDTCGAYDATQIKAAILVLDGAKDPLVPREQLPAFVNEMTTVNVDWQLVSYHDAVHSFTDETANNPGVAEFNPQVTERAFTSMFELLNRVN